MKIISISLILLVLFSFAIGKDDNAEASHRIRQQLNTFLNTALDEFTNGIGSSTTSWDFKSKRWEKPFVTDRLLLLSRMEFYRLAAFSEGLAYERQTPPAFKLYSPRSLWLPISAEGTYSFKILSVSINDQSAEVAVQFTKHLDGKAYKENSVQYTLLPTANDWCVDNITAEGGWDLVRFLKRQDIINN